MTKTKRKPQTPVRSTRLVGLRLTRNDMLQVWRDAIVGHQSTGSSQRAQYDRIVEACDAALFPKRPNVPAQRPPAKDV